MTLRLVRTLGAFLGCATVLSALAADPTPPAETQIPSESKSSAVRLEIDQDIMLEKGSPGFVLYVSGWIPSAEFSITAVDKAGAMIPIVAVDKHLRAGPDGNVSFSIPYGVRGLHPGFWVFVVAGEPGIHQFQLTIPIVEPPTATRKKWSFDYAAAAAADEELVRKEGAQR